MNAAIDVAEQLMQALKREVEMARAERLLLKNIDSTALLERAALRDAFNTHTRHLSERLAGALEAAGKELGVSSVRLETLAERAPEATERLRQALAEIRGLAGALRELDTLNRHLAQRALACLQAYTRRLRPPVQAYTNRGERPVETFATRSERA